MVQPTAQVDGDGGNIGITITGATTADVLKSGVLSNPAISEMIQAILALKDIDSNLQLAWEAYQQGRYDDMYSLVLSSNFYKNNNSIARQRLQAKTAQPGVYADDLAKYKLATRKSLVTSGLKMDAKLFEGLAQTAYDSGMNEDQLKQLIVSSNLVTGYGGNVIGSTDALKSVANSYGVGKYLDDKYWNQKSQDLFLGITTTQDIENEIKNIAASAFPAYADQIKAGISMDASSSSYRSAIANILEVDPNSITYEDPRLRAALQYVGPDGKPAVKPLWQFEKELRMSPEWAYTNNGRTTIDNLTYKTFRDMGLI